MYWLVFLNFFKIKKPPCSNGRPLIKTIMKNCYSKTTKRVVSVSWFIFNNALYIPGCQFSLISTANTFTPFLSISFITETWRPCMSTNIIFTDTSDEEVMVIWNFPRTGFGAIVIPALTDGFVVILMIPLYE